MPVILTAQKSSGAKAYRDLAKEFINRVNSIQDFKKIVSAENEGRELKTDDNRKGCGKICLIRNGREKGRFHS